MNMSLTLKQSVGLELETFEVALRNFTYYVSK